MPDTITVERLVSTGSFEHVKVGVTVQIAAGLGVTKDRIKTVTMAVEQWAQAAKKASELRRELHHLERDLADAQADGLKALFGDEETDNLVVLQSRVDEKKAEFEGLDWGDWSRVGA